MVGTQSGVFRFTNNAELLHCVCVPLHCQRLLLYMTTIVLGKFEMIHLRLRYFYVHPTDDFSGMAFITNFES